MKNIKFIEVRSELGAGTRGASLGIDALKIAALDYRSDLFKKYESVKVQDQNEVLFDPIGSANAKRISAISDMVDSIASSVVNTLKEDVFPIVLSGDHSNAAGTIAGLRRAYPNENIGVIWIDAHADLHTPFTTPSGNVHGMPLAAALNEDNLESQSNHPSDFTKQAWEKIKNAGGKTPMIQPKDICFISLRDYEAQEKDLINRLNLHVIPTSEVRSMGTDRTCRSVLKKLAHCDRLYISFDVDSLDPNVSMGTGTPVPNGLTEKEAANIVLELIHNEKVCCFEITEVNPTLDKENLMAETAFELLQKVVNQLEIAQLPQ